MILLIFEKFIDTLLDDDRYLCEAMDEGERGWAFKANDDDGIEGDGLVGVRGVGGNADVGGGCGGDSDDNIWGDDEDTDSDKYIFDDGAIDDDVVIKDKSRFKLTQGDRSRLSSTFLHRK